MKVQTELLTINKYSRPATKIGKIKNVVIHWVGNAGSSAINNRNYFESLKTKGTYASSHYIVGLEGEIIQCVPEDEVAYHASSANSYSIGIEVCHPNWIGKFNEKTLVSLYELCADICKRYSLNPLTDIIRHYDVTKKICPKYYVENPTEWQQLKSNVNKLLNSNVPSTWARESWEWCTEIGLMDGTSPQGAVTREQLAVILKRFHDLSK